MSQQPNISRARLRKAAGLTIFSVSAEFDHGQQELHGRRGPARASVRQWLPPSQRCRGRLPTAGVGRPRALRAGGPCLLRGPGRGERCPRHDAQGPAGGCRLGHLRWSVFARSLPPLALPMSIVSVSQHLMRTVCVRLHPIALPGANAGWHCPCLCLPALPSA